MSIITGVAGSTITVKTIVYRNRVCYKVVVTNSNGFFSGAYGCRSYSEALAVVAFESKFRVRLAAHNAECPDCQS